MIDSRKLFILFGVAMVFFFLGNNYVSLTDPDEVFYSLTAKEMLLRNDWLTPYIFGHPQFEKPIFTYWLLLCAFKLWGITPWAARFFPALFAAFSVLGIYCLGLLIYRDQQRAFLAGLVLATSAFFVGMGKTVFTDMIFATFILYAIISFYLAVINPTQRPLAIVMCFCFGALATLTKGPLGLAIPLLVGVLFLLYRRRLNILFNPWVLVGFLCALVIALPWYVYMFKTYGSAFIQEFFYNDHWRRVIEAEHRSNDRWFFYPLSMVGGVFPFSIFLLIALKEFYQRLAKSPGEADHLILSWILVVFIIFQAAHSKLVSYILPLFPALALLIADQIARKISARVLMVYSVILGILGVVVLIVPQVVHKKITIPMYPVFWVSGGLIVLGGLVYSFAISSREKLGLYVLSATCMVVLIGAWFAKDTIETEASCSPVSQYLPLTLPEGQRVLTSKPYARGVAFYTGLPVAVFDPGGRGYFSPHPILSFSNDTQLRAFLDSQPVTFAYLKRSGYEHVENNFKDRYNVTLVKTFGSNRLVKIAPLSNIK